MFLSIFCNSILLLKSMLPYRPHPLLRNGHLQTLMLGIAYGHRPAHNATAIELDLDDGERMVVHEENGEPLDARAATAVLIHGLGGDHRSPYLQRIARQLRSNGIRVWRVDLRGAGDGLKLASRPAHAGSSPDLAAVIRLAQRSYPNSAIRIAGFSLGGNILLKMLGEAASGATELPLDLSNIEMALAIAPPVNLHDCATNMDRLSRRVYTRYYLRNLNAQVELRRKQWENWRAIPRFPRVKTIREFDARYTAPLSGFRDTDHYYAVASSDQWMRQIKTPTLILVDRDDPIVTCESLTCCSFDPDFVRIEYTSRGGHLGYYGLDSAGRFIRWMEHYVIHMISQKPLAKQFSSREFVQL
jgi:uncharacterized protein